MITKMWEAFIDELEGMEIPYLIAKDEVLVTFTIPKANGEMGDTYFVFYDAATMDWWFGIVDLKEFKKEAKKMGHEGSLQAQVLKGKAKWLFEMMFTTNGAFKEITIDQSPQHAIDKVKLITGNF